MALPPETPILIVDDSAAIRTRVESYLRQLGFANIETAENVPSGLEKFREQQSDIVFLDLVIDEERGTDFAAQALTEKPFANIVIMTALPPTHEYVTSAVSEGASDYLPKPIRIASIKTVLERIEEGNSAEAKAERENASYL